MDLVPQNVCRIFLLLFCFYCLFLFFNDVFLFYYISVFPTYVSVRVLDPLELGLQTVVNCYVGAGN